MSAEVPLSVEQPESPTSFTLTFWVHGFRATATLRDPSYKVQFHEGLKITADTAKIMADDPRFEPSWERPLPLRPTPELAPNSEADTKLCEVHNVVMKKRSGKGGAAFYSHARKLTNGSWDYCSGSGFKSDK
jgi:hypothetical protein